MGCNAYLDNVPERAELVALQQPEHRLGGGREHAVYLVQHGTARLDVDGLQPAALNGRAGHGTAQEGDLSRG